VDVRVIAATNADLRTEVSAGRFRDDLFFRLNTVEIHLPPLRERPDDVIPLAEHFLTRYAARYRKTLRGFDPAAVTALTRHAWPGNVRELDHAIERAVLLSAGPSITTTDLGLGSASMSTDAAFDQMTLDEAERTLIERALRRHDGNVTDAAKALGVSRSALYRRLASLGVRIE
jgi:DNA-binding NtrC family response regulator